MPQFYRLQQTPEFGQFFKRSMQPTHFTASLFLKGVFIIVYAITPKGQARLHMLHPIHNNNEST